jgi:hypothetical protein
MWTKIASAALFFLLLYARRHEVLVSPNVWNEDGPQIMTGFIDKGPAAFLDPVNGYYVLVPKVISAISLAVSFSRYPLISTVLAWIFIVAVVLVVSSNRTMLKGGVLLGIATLLVPCNPEVFGLPLYTFWWASLLLFLVALWRPERHDVAERLAYVAAGGLSSPVIFVVTPVLLVRAFVFRSERRERVVALAATVCTVIQAIPALIDSGKTAATNLAAISLAVPKFLGGFLIGNLGAFDNPPLLAAAGGAMIVLTAFLLLRRPRDGTYWTLVYLWAATVVATAARMDLAFIHPTLAGPRYFFLPFVLEAWLIVQFIFDASSAPARLGAAGMLVLAFVNMIPAAGRSQDDLDWIEGVRSCPYFPYYALPIQADGTARGAWIMPITGAQCASLLRRDPFAASARSGPIFPYAAFPPFFNALPPPRITGSSAVVTHNGERRVTVRLRRGEAVLFRRGPGRIGVIVTPYTGQAVFETALPEAQEWTVLDFSNALLPARFTVTFVGEATVRTRFGSRGV